MGKNRPRPGQKQGRTLAGDEGDEKNPLKVNVFLSKKRRGERSVPAVGDQKGLSWNTERTGKKGRDLESIMTFSRDQI